MRRNHDRRSYHYQLDVLREFSFQRDNAVGAVAKGKNQAAVVSCRSVIDVAFKFFCPGQQLFWNGIFSAIARAQQESCNHRGRTAP